MNTKRSSLLIFLVAIIIVPLLSGCFAVGEDDPFISFRTRKNRVIGEWDVNYAYSNIRTLIEGSDNLRTITEVDGTNWKEEIYVLGTDSVKETDGTVTDYTMTMDKKGQFNFVYEYEIVEEETDLEGNTTITTINRKNTMEGTWNFLANIDDYSDKERITFVIEKESLIIDTIIVIQSIEQQGNQEGPSTHDVFEYRYANGEMSHIWEINQLKFKEIKMEQEIETQQLNNQDDNAAPIDIGVRQRTLKRQD